MKKTAYLIGVFGMLAAVTLFTAACGKNDMNGGASPSPSSTLYHASPDTLVSPSASIEPSLSPEGSPAGTALQSPDASATGSQIKDFTEGKVVDAKDVPEVVAAVTAKYADAKIETIKHVTRDGEQMYEVMLTSNAKTHTVYVSADGVLSEDE